ncbi:MAG: hypothetical protein P8Z81_09650, partial [Deinococcales bacterium]
MLPVVVFGVAAFAAANGYTNGLSNSATAGLDFFGVHGGLLPWADYGGRRLHDQNRSAWWLLLS